MADDRQQRARSRTQPGRVYSPDFAAAGPTRQGLPTGRYSQAPGSQYDDVGTASPGSGGDQSNLVAFELWVASYECQVLGKRLSNEQPIERVFVMKG